MLDILAAGPFATVQDLGRPGLRGQGVSVGGAMDSLALRVANLLVGEDPGAAGIETTGLPLRVRVGRAALIAVTGAVSRVSVDGVAIPTYTSCLVEAGQVIEVGPAQQGTWSYLAVSGGIEVPSVLGARSTDLKGGYGGIENGRALRPGDSLTLGASPIDPAPLHKRGGFGVLPPPRLTDPEGHTILRIIPGREYGEFDETQQARFWGELWTISNSSNRQGYGLQGRKLSPKTPLNLASYGLIPGVVQIPPAGEPVIQLAEANTCGGYPRMGTIIAPDLSALVQVAVGGKLRMQRITRDEAIAARQATQTYLAHVTETLRSALKWT
ncbi:biotin-dependent carboxyltransferase family protein [Halomonas sp. H2]|uniref:5-oxoprolinase subunit C family protein n=1 Tax=Halomonas sp. H2 TaxID=261936 RepID=UPI003CEFB020